MTFTVYATQLVETNAYMGFVRIPLDAGYFATVGAALVVLTAILPVAVQCPSDFFLLFYGLFVPGSYAVFHRGIGPVAPWDFALQFSLLIAPLLAQRLLANIPLGLQLPTVVETRSVERLLIAVCLVAVAAAMLNRPASASFDLLTVYDRRLEGRLVFAAGSPLAYLVTMVANGLLPFLGFIAGVGKRFRLMAGALAFEFAFFYVVGLKAPILYIMLAFFVGVGMRSGSQRALHRVIVSSVALLFVVFLVERRVWDISLVGEFIFRRVFVAPTLIIHDYFDLVLGRTYGLWSPGTGVSSPNGVTYLIGELYLNSEAANADTNAFLHALAAGGVIAYFGTMFLTIMIFLACDCGFRASRNLGFMFLGFEYAMLISEQAATTALVSSGIALLGVLVGLTGAGWRRIVAPPSEELADVMHGHSVPVA